jgi:hypothetical protein
LVRNSAILLCLTLGLVLAAGPANMPVATGVVNDVNPLAQGKSPVKPFSTFMDPPETVWTRALATTYTVGVTGVQDTLMWVSAGQTELKIYILKTNDPARTMVDSFAQTGGPSGWGIRDMAYKPSTDEVFAGFDGQRFHVYNATTHVPNNTYTVSGYSGTVRGMGYDPVQDSNWTCNFATSPMTKFSITGTNGHQVKAAAEMASSYGIAWDAVQNCFWVSQAGAAGASPIWKMNPDYTIADSFLPAGFDLAGGCEIQRDTYLLVMEQATPDAVWCFKFAFGPGLDHDVGVRGIVDPASNVNPGAITPKANLKNYGANPESNIPVTCWIDSGVTRVYTGNATYAGPLAPGAEAEAQFPTVWNTGPAGADYTVTMFTGLSGDQNTANDTAYGTTHISGAIFSDTLFVEQAGAFAPVIDGVINPGEWTPSRWYDISDLAGRGGTPQPAGSVYAWYLHDNNYMYFAVETPNYTGRVDYDQFGPYCDEDHSGTWATDSSEGNYWCEYVGGDSVIYRALLDPTPNVWLMGLTPDAQMVSSNASGHLVFEAKTPIGPDKWEWNVSPVDTVGYFEYVAVSGGSVFPGWWPQSLLMSQWANCAYYGPMMLVLTGTQEAPKADFALYKASPSVVRDFARISYYVGSRSNVSLGVYDVTGKLVKTLASGSAEPGERTVTWNRTDNFGRTVANGSYFYRLTVDGKSVSSKSVVVQ